MTDRNEDYSPGDVVQFPATHANEHPETGGWDPDTGIFTCPVPGFYMFAATLYKASSTEGNYNHEATLKTSSQGDVAHVYNFQGPQHNSRYSSSMFVIVHCEAGEQVWVQIRDHFPIIDDYWSLGSSQFMGLLLSKDLP